MATIDQADRRAPTISCLMVTKPTPERVRFAKRAIACFLSQSYPNKELVIVVHGPGSPAEGESLERHVESLARDEIKLLHPQGKANLGELRNISLDHARGEVLCQWDDDDLYHPERLSQQAKPLDEPDCEAVLLSDVMHFFEKERKLYCLNWSATPARGHPGTLMVKRSSAIRYPSAGADAARGEDLAVALALHRRERIQILAGAPHLFIYVNHGANTWEQDHHQMLADELAISRGLLLRREVEIRTGLAPLDLGPGLVNVHGRNGPAFEIVPSGAPKVSNSSAPLRA
jgi:glycosyltransferase involved in cell wall biosynthesis